MKKFHILFFFFLLTTITVLAQSPEKMSYQAVLRDATNTLLTNQSVGMQISILQTTINGTSVYTETQIVTTNINGLVSIEIGTGVSLDSFSAIDWSAGPYFIKTETDPDGSDAYTITGTSQLMSVPYAMYAKTSGSSTPGPVGPAGPVGVLDDGTLWSDYLYWDNQVTPPQWKVGSTNFHLGAQAGEFNQGFFGTAVGNLAGNTIQGDQATAVGYRAAERDQGKNAVAVGSLAGLALQGANSVAVGNNAGFATQGENSVAIGANAGENTQQQRGIAIGEKAGNNTQGQSSVAIGAQAGEINQGNVSGSAVAIGYLSGQTDQSNHAVAIGQASGTLNQGARSVAVGFAAGAASQGANSVAIGAQAGGSAQETDCIAIGDKAGQINQGLSSIAIGSKAGNNGQLRGAIAIGQNAQESGGFASIAIGIDAGNTNQGEAAIAIGKSAGTTNQAAKSIIINATGIALQNTTASTLKIAPIAPGQNVNVLSYNTITSEVNYSNTGPVILPANSINITDFGDRDLFDDGVVRIWLDDSTTDDIELEITNFLAPAGSVYHVSWTNFQSGGVGGATNVVDLNAGGVTSSTTLDFNFTTDEYMTIRIWSPAIGLTWGFYEAKIIKSSSLYTGTPVLCSVRKSF